MTMKAIHGSKIAQGEELFAKRDREHRDRLNGL
jgi:hypothetical protein